MADYDSDSSGGEDIETNVVLGYVSKESTTEPFSQLGGHPTWLDEVTAPPGAFANCKICNSPMSLLLQIRGDLEQFPTHERRLYIWACRRKACRRKEGSVRGFRAIRQSVGTGENTSAVTETKKKQEISQPVPLPRTNLGETLFGVKAGSVGQANPFSTTNSDVTPSNPFASGSSAAQSNPFATASSLAAKPAQKPAATESFPETFAQKARIAATEAPEVPSTTTTHEPWPAQSSFPKPYPSYYIDPDKEYIEAEETSTPSGVKIEGDSGEGSSSSNTEDKAAFESSMDKTFQKFADRLAQNPEQVLRYEYKGQPLLYAKNDAVGKLLASAQEGANAKIKTAGGAGVSKMPRCANCGAERVFELQLTPHAITELEAEEMSIEGMDWGTIILGVCSKDCQEKIKKQGEVGYVEEWVGVQWEELAGSKKPA